MSSQQPYSAFPVQISNAGYIDNNIVTVTGELKKPKAEIQIFNGNTMNFLLQFTSGEAHGIVMGYSHL